MHIKNSAFFFFLIFFRLFWCPFIYFILFYFTPFRSASSHQSTEIANQNKVNKKYSTIEAKVLSTAHVEHSGRKHKRKTASRGKAPDQEAQEALKMTSVSIVIQLSSVAISLSVEKPVRREFLSLFIQGVLGKIRLTAAARTFELSVHDAQLDSYSETCVSPVALHTLRDEESETAPLLYFILVEESHPETATPHFKYIAARLLEVSVAIDSATLQLLILDLGCDFGLVARDQGPALHSPELWARDFNTSTFLSENRFHLVDIRRSQLSAQADRVYIENLVIHPIKVTLSFQQTSVPRKQDLGAGYADSSLSLAETVVAALSYIPAFVSVDRVALKLNSFIVADCMESSRALASRVLAQSWKDLRYQLANLAGALAVLGRPVGLARNIGGGVQAFFYEPYQVGGSI